VAPPDNALSTPPLSLRHEFVRKALHLSTAAITILYALGASRALLAALLALAVAAALFVERARRVNREFGARFDHMVGSLTRDEEKHGLTGATWLALSCFVAVVVLSRGAAIAALWCATVGDPSATIVGRLWAESRPERAPGTKSLAGSFACFAVSFAGTCVLAGYAPPGAMMVGIAAAVAEALQSRIDDNIRVCAAAGIVAQIFA
jgi:dolichol kinase